jgi:serine/threonine protein kinase
MLHLEGREVGGCKLIRKIGAGGMGEVYLGEQLRVGNRPVAVKVVDPEDGPGYAGPADQAKQAEVADEVARRFQREAALLGRLSHPDILPVYDSGVEHLGDQTGDQTGDAGDAGDAGGSRSDRGAGGTLLYLVMAYQLLAGRTPFEGELGALTRAHLYEAPPPPRTVNPAIPAAVEAVVLRALSKDPAQRYPTVAAFAQALRTAARVGAGASQAETQAATPIASGDPGDGGETAPAIAAQQVPQVPPPLPTNLPRGVASAPIPRPAPPTRHRLPSARPVRAGSS